MKQPQRDNAGSHRSEKRIAGSKVRESMRCVRCVLPAHTLGIHFNDDGVCDHCLDFDNHPPEVDKNNIKSEMLQSALVSGLKKKTLDSKYDCLLALSGGKDSVSALYYLTTEFNLKVLAYTFDNGLIENETIKKIEGITASLNVDWILSDSNSEIFKCYIRHFLLSPLRTRVQLCTYCGTIKPIFIQDMLRVAGKYNIPLLVSGVGLEEITILDNQDYLNQRKMSIVYRNQLRNTLKFPLSFDIDPLLDFAPEYVPFWRYSTRNIDETINVISNTIGWKTHDKSFPGNSTNCLLSLLDQYLSEKYNIFSQYENEFSLKIRLGEIERETALECLNKQADKDVLNSVAQQCDLNFEEL